MTTIPPSLPPVPVSSGGQAVVTATPVSDVPPQIAALPSNATIDATVTATQAVAQATANAAAAASASLARSNVVQLSTALGTVTVRLPMPVAPNTNLRLQMIGTGATAFLRVIAINGQALAGGNPAPAIGEPNPLPLPPLAGPLTGNTQAAGAAPLQQLPQTGAQAANGAAAGETIPTPSPGSGLPATVVFGTDSAIPNGTQLTVRLLDIVPPGAANPLPLPGAMPASPLFPPSATPLPGAPAVVAQPALPGATPLVPGTPPAAIPVPPGGPVGIGPAAPEQIPGAPTLAAQTPATDDSAAPAVPSTLPGTVAPNSLGGKPLIQTPIGLLTLDAGPDLLPGSQLTLQTVGTPQPPPAASVHPTQAQAQTGWTSFGEAMAVLQKADPAAAQFLVQRLPDLGPQFVSNMITWVAAAQTGDVRAWLGKRTVDALEKAGRADLIAKLDDDMAGMRTPVNLPQLGDGWQSLTLPLFFGQRIERVRLTMRRAKEGEDGVAGGDEEGLRFLVDVDMSVLGAMQFDGLVKRQAKHFDLIVRSRLELPDRVQRDINGIFTRSLEGLGMTGGAVFKQTVAFIEPLPTDINHAGLTA